MLTAADFIHLRHSMGAGLESLFRSDRLKLDGEEPQALGVLAMCARALVPPIDRPAEALAGYGRAFRGPTMAFMRGAEGDLTNAFPGYRRRLATARRRPQENPFTGEPMTVEDHDPDDGFARYRPIDPPLPFASVDVLDVTNGEGIVELLLQITRTSIGSEFECYGDMFTTRFPQGLFGGRDLDLLEVPDEFVDGASLLDAQGRREIVCSLLESGTLISVAVPVNPLTRQLGSTQAQEARIDSLRDELEAAVAAVCNLSQAATEADERLWLWCNHI